MLSCGMTYLVTGATGFIGSYVVKQLLDEGEAVIGYDRSWPNALEMVMGDASHGLVAVVGDVTDFPSLARTVREHGVDRIIHLAAELHSASAENPWKCIQSNVVGNHNVLELGRLFDIARIVTASSAALFGPPDRHPEGIVRNDARLYAGDVYEASKIFGESEGQYYYERFGIDNVAIRIGLAYGYGCTIGWGKRMIEELLEKPMRGEPGRPAFGDSDMNWTYAFDAADVFVRASRASATGTFAYNVAGDSRPIKDAAEIARRLIPGSDVEAVPGAHPWAQLFDDTPLRRDFGGKVEWSLEAGLEDLLGRLRHAAATA